MTEYRWFKNGRMITKSKDFERTKHYNMTKEYFDDYVAINKHFVGVLELPDSGITSLGKLESVKGDVFLSYTNIESLGELKNVNGHLFLGGLEISTLGKLETVEGYLDLEGVDHLTSLGNLKSVDRIYCVLGSDTHELFMDSEFRDRVTVI